MMVGHIWLVVIAFKKSIVWGLVTLLTGFWGSLVFICLNWQMTKKQFFIYLIGFSMIPISVIPMMMLNPDKFAKGAKEEAIDTNPQAPDTPGTPAGTADKAPAPAR